MTDFGINRALALAIGWKEENIYLWHRKCVIHFDTVTWTTAGKNFDYRDPAIIWPIAKRYDTFPCKRLDGKWVSLGLGVVADTPEKAVALAVIEQEKK